MYRLREILLTKVKNGPSMAGLFNLHTCYITLKFSWPLPIRHLQGKNRNE